METSKRFSCLPAELTQLPDACYNKQDCYVRIKHDNGEVVEGKDLILVHQLNVYMLQLQCSKKKGKPNLCLHSRT